MSEWKKVKLGEICDSQYGYTASTIEENTGTKFLRITDIVPNQIDWDAVPFCKISNEERDKYILHKGDIVVARTGATVGYAKYIKQDVQSVFASYLVRFVVKREDVFSQYVGYCVESNLFKDYINSIANGSAQPNANSQMMSSFELKIPSLPTQHRIATILSRYDSLIENYQKQIKLLEEAAQRLYKEWFVDLHFPGHENVKIVDGVPEGWEKKTLDDFCSVFTGKKNANAAVLSGKYKFFTCGDTPLQIDSYIYDGPAIIISGNGSYTGRTTFYEGRFDLYQRTYACTINNNENQDLIYGLFEIVKCELTTQISGGTHGAAIPYIVMGDVTKFTFTSNDIVLRKFSKIIKSFLDRTMCISSQIRLLTEARDRLLPKLMSGEIAV